MARNWGRKRTSAESASSTPYAPTGEPSQLPAPDESAPESAKPPGVKIKGTRVSGTWIAVIIALVVLVFLLIFILQNLGTATVRFFGASGSLPLAVAMLLAAVAGGLVVALIGIARIFQLRKATRRAGRWERWG